MWAAFDLQPHRSQIFKLSSDPLFVDKVRDIVGLYLPADTIPSPQHRWEKPVLDYHKPLTSIALPARP
jgi:hypothetical protein